MVSHQLIYLFAPSLFWAAAPSVYTPLGLSTPWVSVCDCARTRLHVQRMLQQAHLVAMCQCHWPPCSPSGWYTRSASSDSCSIRGPLRLTDARTQPKRAYGRRNLEAASEEAWKWIPPLWWSFTYFNLNQMLLTVRRDYWRHQILWLWLCDTIFGDVACFIYNKSILLNYISSNEKRPRVTLVF